MSVGLSVCQSECWSVCGVLSSSLKMTKLSNIKDTKVVISATNTLNPANLKILHNGVYKVFIDG